MLRFTRTAEILQMHFSNKSSFFKTAKASKLSWTIVWWNYHFLPMKCNLGSTAVSNWLFPCSGIAARCIWIQQTNLVVKRWFTRPHCAFGDAQASSVLFVAKGTAAACCSTLAPGEIVLGSPARLLPVMCHLKALWNLPSWLREANNNKSALCATCSTHLGGFKYAGVMAPIPSVWRNTARGRRLGANKGVWSSTYGWHSSASEAFVIFPPLLLKNKHVKWLTLASLRHTGGVFHSLCAVMAVMSLCLAWERHARMENNIQYKERNHLNTGRREKGIDGLILYGRCWPVSKHISHIWVVEVSIWFLFDYNQRCFKLLKGVVKEVDFKTVKSYYWLRQMES